jgi:hypothetical protein
MYKPDVFGDVQLPHRPVCLYSDRGCEFYAHFAAAQDGVHFCKTSKQGKMFRVTYDKDEDGLLRKNEIGKATLWKYFTTAAASQRLQTAVRFYAFRGDKKGVTLMATDGGADEFSGYDAVGVQPREPEDTGFERIISSTEAELGHRCHFGILLLTIGQSTNAAWFYLWMVATSSTVDALLSRGESHQLSLSLDYPPEFRAHVVTVRQCLNGNGVSQEAEDNLTDLLDAGKWR